MKPDFTIGQGNSPQINDALTACPSDSPAPQRAAEYDYQNGHNEPGNECKGFHAPSMSQSAQTAIRKSLA